MYSAKSIDDKVEKEIAQTQKEKEKEKKTDKRKQWVLVKKIKANRKTDRGDI